MVHTLGKPPPQLEGTLGHSSERRYFSWGAKFDQLGAKFDCDEETTLRTENMQCAILLGGLLRANP